MGWTQRRPRPGGLLTGRGLDRFDQSGGWWEAIHLPSCSERAAKVWVWQRKGKELSDCTVPVCRGGADARQRWAKGGRTDDAGGSDRAHPRRHRGARQRPRALGKAGGVACAAVHRARSALSRNSGHPASVSGQALKARTAAFAHDQLTDADGAHSSWTTASTRMGVRWHRGCWDLDGWSRDVPIFDRHPRWRFQPVLLPMT